MAGDAARLEAEVLLAHVLGVSRARLLLVDGVDPAACARFAELIDERAVRARPVAYLVGRRAFLDLELCVDERVLVPRPETELLVERFAALDAAGRVPAGRAVDLGTGSGAIAFGLAARRQVLAIERSSDALDVAALNRARLAAGDGPSDARLRAARTALLRGDGLGMLRPRSVAAVVANPPYIPPDEHARLARDVREHEPRQALVPDGGDPRAHFADLARQAARVLVPGGWLLVEVGAGQADEVVALFAAAGFEGCARQADLAGIPRVVEARLGAPDGTR
ncbi:MAG: peptide chain release factor N(5)-glutamine methyltransferase [Planctomycetes bacterium]|nr:peptide chain release factor N(5)-glutamine methyltransferase [Planctomycetota bacterium]